MDDVFLRAERRRMQALDVLERLSLLARWSRYGSPVIVGALRHRLVVAPDIDLEIYSDDPRIEHGFHLMSEVAQAPGVWKVRFSNELSGPDQGLYWGIRYRGQDGEIWKTDNWLLSHHHPHAHWAEKLAIAMGRALTEETRRVILEIKEAMIEVESVRSIDVYRAVLEGHVRCPCEFRQWLEEHKPTGIVLWLPSCTVQ
jgi:hypothetical protein